MTQNNAWQGSLHVDIKETITTDQVRLDIVEKLIREGKITLSEGIKLITDRNANYTAQTITSVPNPYQSVMYFNQTHPLTDIGGTK